MILALLSTVHAAELGTDWKLGVGGATGDTFIAATGKYFLTDKFGVSGYLGTSIVRQRLRVNTELDLVSLAELDVADLELYVLLGVDFGLGTSYGVSAEIGGGLGAGISMRFNNFPAEAFLDVGAGGYPVCATSFWYWCYVQPRADLGFRWYVL